MLDDAIGHLNGIGELFIYDAAVCVGAKLGLKPNRVYLHRGTPDGAIALGFDRDRTTLSRDELPSAFHRLCPGR